MSTPQIRVRRARHDDVPALHGLIRELAEYEREPDAVEATPDDLHRALFAEQPLLHAFVAELTRPSGHQPNGTGADGTGADGTEPDTSTSKGSEVAGMALWFVSYSTWRGRHGIWLEDLFVSPRHRGLGLGRALLAELAAEAVRRGYARLEWNVLDWNEPALGFYARLGARPLSEWTVHRLSDDALTALAATSSSE